MKLNNVLKLLYLLFLDTRLGLRQISLGSRDQGHSSFRKSYLAHSVSGAKNNNNYYYFYFFLFFTIIIFYTLGTI